MAVVVGPSLEDAGLLGAAKGLEFAAGMDEDAGLDGGDGVAIVDGRGGLPGEAEVTGALEVDAPAAAFDAGGAKDFAVGELDGFVFYGAEDAVGEAAGFGPGFAVVVRGEHHAPPSGGAGADFVEEEKRAVGGLEEDGVPARETVGGGLDAVGELDGRGPVVGFVNGRPDADVGRALAGAAEPGGDEVIAGFGDGGGVAFGEGSGFVDEFGFEEGGLGGRLVWAFRERVERSTKIQHPSTREAPSSKRQRGWVHMGRS